MKKTNPDRALRLSAVLPLSGHGQAILQGVAAWLKSGRAVWSLRPVNPTAATLTDELEQWSPEGVLIQSGCPKAEEWCRKAGVPFVSLLAPKGADSGDANLAVVMDDTAVGRMAAQYFHERGYRHFAFVGNGTHAFSLDRQAGFAGWLQAHGHAVFDFVHSTPEFDPRPKPRILYHAAMAEWLSGLPKPCAIFAANDWEALAVLQAATSAGLSLPEDLSLLGAGDDKLICRLCTPEISSIKLPFARLGSKAVRLLLPMITGKRGVKPKPGTPLAPLTIVTRASSADFGVANPLVRKALDYMNAHIAEPFKLNALFREIGTSRPSLERHFKAEFGETPLVVLRNLRIERARQLLADTSLNNAEIAARSGFSSNIRFVTVFKQMVGVPPGTYRENLQFENLN